MSENDDPPWSDASQPDRLSIWEELHAAEKLLPAGANEHDRAILLISVCIDNGIDDGAQIVAVLTQYGFDKSHIGIWLKAGTYPKTPTYWEKDGTGRYRNVPPP